MPKSDQNNEVIVVDASEVSVENQIGIAESEKLRKQVLTLRDTIEKSYYGLGKELRRVMDGRLRDGTPVWKSWGFVSFDDYCERELGFRERKAYYLLDVFASVENGPFSEEDVERLGWTKAASLAPLVKKGIITQNNVSDWLDKTQGKSYQELREITSKAKSCAAKVASEARSEATKNGTDPDKAVAEAVGKISAESVDIQKSTDTIYMFRVGFHEEQWNVWQTALKKAKDITGSDKDAWLVECIASAFLAECLNNRDDMLEVMLSRLEEAYGVKILAVNHAGEVQHCHEDIASLSDRIQ